MKTILPLFFVIMAIALGLVVLLQFQSESPWMDESNLPTSPSTSPPLTEVNHDQNHAPKTADDATMAPASAHPFEASPPITLKDPKENATPHLSANTIDAQTKTHEEPNRPEHQAIVNLRNKRLEFLRHQQFPVGASGDPENHHLDLSMQEKGESEDENSDEASAEEEEEEDKAVQYQLNLTVVMEGEVVSGINLYWLDELAYPEQGGPWPAGRFIASTGMQGRASIPLIEGQEGVLILLGGAGPEVVFRGALSDDLTLRYELKYPLDAGSSLMGKVLNRYDQPQPGVLVANRAISTEAEHLVASQDPSYRYSQSNANGDFILSQLPSSESITLSVIALSTQEVLSNTFQTQEPKSIVQTGTWKMETLGGEPAQWTITIIDADQEPISGVLVTRRPFNSYEEALGDNEPFYTDAAGQIVFTEIEPETTHSLYAHTPELGSLHLESHTFSTGELYSQSYPLKMGGDDPARLGLRLQSKEGYDVRSGWVSTTPFQDESEIPSLLEQGQYIGAVSPGLTLWLEDLEPHIDYPLYYISNDGESLYLRTLKLGSGESRNLGPLRLDNNALLDSYVFGQVFNEDRQPIPGLALELRWGINGKVMSTTDELGYYNFENIDRHQRISIWGTNSEGRVSLLMEDTLLDDLQLMKDLIWKDLQSLTFKVLYDNMPIENAHVSLEPVEGASTAQNLSGEATVRLDQVTDPLGRVAIDGLEPGRNYRISVVHTFYEKYSETLTINDQEDDVEIELEALRGVKVQLQGPLFEEGIHIRAWIGIARQGLIVPDYQPGNEYGEVIEDPNLLFATPPQENFWVYIGGLPTPWGNGIHGPYSPHRDEVIEIELKEVQPFTVDISRSPKPPGFTNWNLLIYAKERSPEAIVQLQGQQLTVYKVQSTHFYLKPDDYLVRVQSDWYDKSLTDIRIDEEGDTLALTLTPRENSGSTEGWWKSFLVSDPLPLVLSQENSHHQEMYYGFNVDFLSHLGGEATYRARHLGEHRTMNGDLNITWRQIDLPESQWHLNLKSSQLFPGDRGEYATVYVQGQALSPSSRMALLGINSDDGFKAWVNGELVDQINIARPIFRSGREGPGDQDQILVRLKAGLNQFNFKVTNSIGHFQFAARLLDPGSLRPLDDVTYLPEALNSN